MVSFWLETAMPTTLTLKNIPDALYGRLKETADAHRRSLNSGVIVCLESILLPQKISVDERLTRARQIRQTLAGVAFSARDIAQLRGEGRP
jgi:antitoxin FitA